MLIPLELFLIMYAEWWCYSGTYKTPGWWLNCDIMSSILEPYWLNCDIMSGILEPNHLNGNIVSGILEPYCLNGDIMSGILEPCSLNGDIKSDIEALLFEWWHHVWHCCPIVWMVTSCLTLKPYCFNGDIMSDTLETCYSKLSVSGIKSAGS